nr:MAG: hypothetical protein [Microvirus sp.]
MDGSDTYQRHNVGEHREPDQSQGVRDCKSLTESVSDKTKNKKGAPPGAERQGTEALPKDVQRLNKLIPIYLDENKYLSVLHSRLRNFLRAM